LQILFIKEINVLANHTYASDTPEARALRQAFKCSALIIAIVAVLFYTGRPDVKTYPSETSASAKENSSPANSVDPSHKDEKPLHGTTGARVSSPKQVSGEVARQAAFRQSKPVGSVFTEPNRQSKTAQVSPQRQATPMDSHRLARLQP
jgi:hypothetical protein